MDLSSFMGSLIGGLWVCEITLMFPKVNLLQRYRGDYDMQRTNISFAFLESLFILTQNIFSVIWNDSS